VVLLGTAVECGIDMAEVMEAIFASNMTKEGGGMRADGKVLKGPHFVPVNLEPILVSQGWVKS
jgi:predicted HAD superfamily Cof-like phosphohydrolase